MRWKTNGIAVNSHTQRHQIKPLFSTYIFLNKLKYSELFWSVFFRIQNENGRMQARLTLNMDTFHAVIYH